MQEIINVHGRKDIKLDFRLMNYHIERKNVAKELYNQLQNLLS